MIDLCRELESRYRTLSESRTAPVFFIEHGLADTEVADLIGDLRRALDVHPIDSDWWDTHSLSLIVGATEVGYRYRGSGTDFWPVLEEELGAQLSGASRQRIRDFFVLASQRFRGARPPATPWAEAFHLIAWPITHALVPMEFHRPLALTLAQLRVNVTGLDDTELYRAVRAAEASSSARFSSLLEDAGLVVAITRSLLGDGGAELCPEATRRIAEDLAADQVARHSVAVALKIQRITPTRRTRVSDRDRQISVSGRLQLRLRGDSRTLEAAFPPIEAQLQSRMRGALRRRRYAPRLWGASAPVPSDQLLSGLPFTLKLALVPSADAELFPTLEEVELDQDVRSALARFALDITPPLLFAVGADGKVARLVRGPSISGHRKYWVLTAAESSPTGVTRLEDVGPYACCVLDPAEDAARDALAGLGFQVRFGVSADLIGAPPLDLEASTFLAGDELIVVPRRTPPGGLTIELDGLDAHVTEDEVVRVHVRAGHNAICRSDTGEPIVTFVGAAEPRPLPPAICTITKRSDDLSIQALLSGRLSFMIESFATIEGLELTVELDLAGRVMYARAPLGPLPCTVSSELEPFATLLDKEAREQLMQAPGAELCLRAGNLCTRSWVLERRVRPCWWNRVVDGRTVLMSELGELPFGAVAAATPAASPTPERSESMQEVRLLAPLELDLTEYSPTALFTTLCVSPRKLRLEPPVAAKPRLVRRRRAGSGVVGLEDLFDGYLRWSLADSDSVLADLRRRQVAGVLDTWTAELCCGESWARRESDLVGADPWELLVEVCDELGLGRDSYVKLSRADEVELTRIAVAEIRREQPELWTRVGPPSDLDADDYEALDLACGRAYGKLAARYEQQGWAELATMIEEGDPGAAVDDWDAAFQQIKTRVELHPLAAMLTPSNAAHQLMSLDPLVMTLDELAEELLAWARGARRALAGSMPSLDTLKAILALWLEPDLAVELNWRGALDTMLSDRAISRAARYLAQRGRLVKQQKSDRR